MDNGVMWSFNPPFAPQKAIQVVLGNVDVNDEEMTTTFIGMEALLNSRPLTYQSAHPKDTPILTPNHFLHGQIGGESRPEIGEETAYNPKNWWRRV